MPLKTLVCSAGEVTEAASAVEARRYLAIPETLDWMDFEGILGTAFKRQLIGFRNNTNLVMKRLTVVAAIFLPLGFITGFWGMNFTSFMPVENAFWWWGSLAVMIILTAGLMVCLSLSVVRRER